MYYDYEPLLNPILNGCNVHNGLYIAKHDRTVDSILKNRRSKVSFSVKVNKHCLLWPAMATLYNTECVVFSAVTDSTLDVLTVHEDSAVLDMGCRANTN